ncbi:MAG: thioesterase family protein [Bacteroidales bacterium]|nr:thioesterase family protein [Bacteroidales bacterium]
MVDAAKTAEAVGSGLLPVFATPSMIALMEETAHRSVASYIPNGSTTVGILINIQHIKPTALGKKVFCISKLDKTDGRRLFFSVEAYDEDGKIGFGTHERSIVDTERFMAKL